MTEALLNPAAYLQIISVTLQVEGYGKLSMDPSDPGNWTGGEVNKGTLRGTRWGFSAASFPTLNLETMDRAQAICLAFQHYWLPAKCNDMPGILAILMFDAAFQHGVGAAVEMLQSVLGQRVDGEFGAKTMEALRAAVLGPGAVRALCISFQRARLMHMVAQSSWQRDAKGLGYRLLVTMVASAQFEDSPKVSS